MSIQTDDEVIVTKVPMPKSIYFGGSCFASCYYIGVCEAMSEYWGKDFHHSTLVSGDSAGSLVALSFALGQNKQEMEDLYLGIAHTILNDGCRPFLDNQSQCFDHGVQNVLRQYPDAYKDIEGRCAIGVTELFGKHRWHMSFENNDELANIIQGSSHIPLFCSRHTSKSGATIIQEVVDGAFGIDGSDYPHGNDTLLIGFDPIADIRGVATVKEMMFPHIDDDFDTFVREGYADFYKWINRGAPYSKKAEIRKPNHKVLYILWFFKILEIMLDFLRQTIMPINISNAIIHNKIIKLK